ncbi:MAG: hypothetical protein OSA84_09470 [Akkermansiaceae bacterium]|nr:hypothetical protein [Akkermansiaceae bacterium]
MRLPVLLLALFGTPVVAEDLTHSDRKALLERLEMIRKESPPPMSTPASILRSPPSVAR